MLMSILYLILRRLLGLGLRSGEATMAPLTTSTGVSTPCHASFTWAYHTRSAQATNTSLMREKRR
jgi:hypothetical protein